MFDRAAAVNSDAQLYKQAGNGVTIPVVYAVGKRIVEIQNELDKECLLENEMFTFNSGSTKRKPRRFRRK